ncbi:response regulator transcription factor [Verrucomicrobium sp. BvORR034]|uniref:response regulator transcription factor n=1 Tax=Verrucomicrobium sp. BvORR034 TaxID=1396418 RepID=UPI0006794179|nr:response regulator transcription factor [Verrucomicrobium sp. BvORR034]
MADASDTSQPSPPESVPVSVWLVEDHKTYGERLMRALNRLEGIVCSQRFTAVEDAVARLQAGGGDPPAVLLLDVELPGMSGIEGIASLKAYAPNLAIVILTVFEDDDKIFRAICAGAAGYLLKTAGVEDIAGAIRTAASGGSPINPAIARRVLEMFSKVNAGRAGDQGNTAGSEGTVNRGGQASYGLTPRELQILELLVQGHTIKQAAGEMGIGYYTADEYIRSVYEKLQVRSRGGAIAKAVKERLV